MRLKIAGRIRWTKRSALRSGNLPRSHAASAFSCRCKRKPFGENSLTSRPCVPRSSNGLSIRNLRIVCNLLPFIRVTRNGTAAAFMSFVRAYDSRLPKRRQMRPFWINDLTTFCYFVDRTDDTGRDFRPGDQRSWSALSCSVFKFHTNVRYTVCISIGHI